MQIQVAQPLTASGIPQLHFDLLHAIAHHLHVMKYGKDYNLWEDTTTWPYVNEETIHQTIETKIRLANLERI
jgi:hypothetical protein